MHAQHLWAAAVAALGAVVASSQPGQLRLVLWETLRVMRRHSKALAYEREAAAQGREAAAG